MSLDCPLRFASLILPDVCICAIFFTGNAEYTSIHAACSARCDHASQDPALGCPPPAAVGRSDRIAAQLPGQIARGPPSMLNVAWLQLPMCRRTQTTHCDVDLTSFIKHRSNYIRLHKQRRTLGRSDSS